MNAWGMSGRSMAAMVAILLAIQLPSFSGGDEPPVAGITDDPLYDIDIHPRVPSAFIENRGQLDRDDVRFYDTAGGVWFTAEGVWLDLWKDDLSGDTRSGVVLRQEFVGASPLNPEGVDRMPGRYNFFYGSDPDGWVTDVPSFGEVLCRDVWDGIDLRYYRDDGSLKYDLIVHPGADPDDIHIRYDGAEEVAVDGEALLIRTEAGTFRDSGLYVYQKAEDVCQVVAGRFVVLGGCEYGFSITGEYDRGRELVIDPVVEASTYFGGSNDDQAYDIAVDDNESMYITGNTLSTNLPLSVGAYQSTHQGGTKDCFVAKMTPDAKYLEYSTYLGGGASDESLAICLDAEGNALITGTTYSGNFPVTSGSYDQDLTGSFDAFVTKLNDNGSALVFSSYIGGSWGESGELILVDPLNRTIIAGRTTSLDFPITPGALNTTFRNNYDIFILALDQGGDTLNFSAAIGEDGHDLPASLIIDHEVNIYIGGRTSSLDYPTTNGCYSGTLAGGEDMILTKLNSNCSSLLYSTFIGGNEYDGCRDLALDADGNVFLTGTSYSSDYPVTPGAYDTVKGGATDAVVLKMNLSGQGQYDLKWATYLGGITTDRGLGIDIDGNDEVIVSGSTASVDFPLLPHMTPPGNYDMFVTRFLNNGTDIRSSTMAGGGSVDEARNCVLSPDGMRVIITGKTESVDFPTSNGSFQDSLQGGEDGFVTVIPLYSGIDVNTSRLMAGAAEVELVYAHYREYSFNVWVYDSGSIYDIDRVVLRLDPGLSDIALKYTPSTGTFGEESDPLDAVGISNTSEVLQSGFAFLSLKFIITFNWQYPHEDLNNVSVRAVGKSLPDAWHNLTDVFRVENDITLKGTVEIQGEDDRPVYHRSAVRGGESLRWYGLTPVYEGTTVVYPPNEEFNITISDTQGESGSCSPDPGEEMSIEMVVTNISHTKSDGGLNLTVNITAIPPECDGSDHRITLYVDGDNVTFLKPSIPPDEWQRKRELGVSVVIRDISDAGVEGDSVRCSWSTDGGVNWRTWEPVYDVPSGQTVQAGHEVDLWDGEDNLVKWRASDQLGNGPAESPAYTVLVDTEPVKFSRYLPDQKEVSATREVTVGITISDTTSGVNGSLVYCGVSEDLGKTWTWWEVHGVASGKEVNVTQDLRLPNGTDNWIRWRAYDIAGNVAESETSRVSVNTYIDTRVPQVVLSAPRNNSVITEKFARLEWSVTDPGIPDVVYDIYLDTIYPPGKQIVSGISNEHHDALDLQDSTLYYWTVVPWNGKVEGDCVDGIWSFEVDTSAEFPRVQLDSPGSGEILNSRDVTLKWTDLGSGIGWTYEIYFSEHNPPELYATSSRTGEFGLTGLADGSVYYWTILPISGPGVVGDWTSPRMFSVDVITPLADYGITLDPVANISIIQGGSGEVRVTLRHTGLLDDRFRIHMDSGTLGKQAAFYSATEMFLQPDEHVRLSIHFNIREDTVTGNHTVKVTASSLSAEAWGVNISHTISFSVEVLEADTGPPVEPPGGGGGGGSSSGLSGEMMLIIAIVLLLVFAAMAGAATFIWGRRKRRREDEDAAGEEEGGSGALVGEVVKPGEAKKDSWSSKVDIDATAVIRRSDGTLVTGITGSGLDHLADEQKARVMTPGRLLPKAKDPEAVKEADGIKYVKVVDAGGVEKSVPVMAGPAKVDAPLVDADSPRKSVVEYVSGDDNSSGGGMGNRVAGE